MRALLKIAGVYLVATLPFAWQLHTMGHDLPRAVLYGLRAPYGVIVQLAQGTPVGLLPLGLFVFILFLGLTAVWATESNRS
jgi:hypothetical protein